MALGEVYTNTDEIADLNGTSRKSEYANLQIQYDKAFDTFVHVGDNVTSMVTKKKGKMGGRKKVALVTYALPQSMGYSTVEGAKFPAGKTGLFDDAELLSRKLSGRLRWTADALLASRSGEFAFKSTRERDQSDGEKQWILNFKRKLLLGSPDIIGIVSAWDNSTKQITVGDRNARTSTAAGVSGFYQSGGHYLRNGMAIGLLDKTQGTSLSLTSPETNQQDMNTTAVRFISSLDTTTTPTAPTFLIGSSFSTCTTPESGDYLIAYGARKNASGVYYADDSHIEDKLLSPNGIPDITASTTLKTYLYALSRTTVPGLNGTYLNGGGTRRQWSDEYMTLLIDLVDENGNGNNMSDALLNRSMRREVVKEHVGETRYAAVQEAERGFKKLVHLGGDVMLPYTTDRDALPGMVQGIARGTWGWWESSPFRSLPERWVADEDSVEQPYTKAGNIECVAPLNNGCADDFIDDVFTLTGV